MKGRCCTCKNWKRNMDNSYSLLFGECSSEKLFNGCGRPSDQWPLGGLATWEDFIDYCDIMTSEVFGCIHHSPLPGGITK